MVLDSADAAPVRDPDDDGHLDASTRAVAQLREMAGDLLERGIRERVELHLDNRAQAVHRHADRGADDARLGQRSVEDAGFAEVGGQAVGDTEDATQRAHVLAEHQDPLVSGERVGQRPIQRPGHRDRLGGRGRCGDRHGAASSSASAAAWARSAGVGVA